MFHRCRVVRDDVGMGSSGMSPRAEPGLVRLTVANLDRSLTFYNRVLGFEVTHPVSRVAVLTGSTGRTELILRAADGGQPSAPSRGFSIRYADRASLADALRRIDDAHVTVHAATEDGLTESLHLRDPDGHEIELYVERPRDTWPVNADGVMQLVSRTLDLDSVRTALRGAAPRADQSPLLSDETRGRLAQLRTRLLNLHKVLLDDAKAAYELDRGRVGSSASLLQLVINDPWFAWLHPLSELVVRIDETLQPDAPASEADGSALLGEVERLLTPGQATPVFAERYYEALQRQPSVIVAHAEVRRILKQVK